MADSSNNSLRIAEAKRPFNDVRPPGCVTVEKDFGDFGDARPCIRLASLVTRLAALSVERECGVDQVTVDRFAEFAANCSEGLLVENACSTGRQICQHPDMPDYLTPSMDELAQRLLDGV